MGVGRDVPAQGEWETMGYALGIDVGTTFTAAAVYRDSGPSIVQLGTHRAEIPSVVVFRGDDTVLTGDAAERRSRTEPDRVAREFKRRFGDETPMFIGGSPRSPEMITSRLLRDVVDSVIEREGGPPTEGIAVTHPASWSEYKRNVLEQAVRMAGLSNVTLLAEPIAAAVHYASLERVPDDALIAVYDLGGGTFDAAVVAKRGERFELGGEPEGIERLGGVDFDAAVLEHVRTQLGDALDDLDLTGTEAVRLRADCIEAKEALSTDTDVTVTALTAGREVSARLTRGEFEEMIRPVLDTSIEALRRALASAGARPADLHAVLLVGGSSRIPLVAELVGNAFGRPVAVDVHPKHSIALGAARYVAHAQAGAPVPTPPPTSMVPPPPPASGRSGGRGKLIAAVAAVLALLGVGVVAAASLGSGGDGTATGSDTRSVTEPAPTTAQPTTVAPPAPTTTITPTTAAPTTAAAPTTTVVATTQPQPAPQAVPATQPPPATPAPAVSTTVPGDLGLAVAMRRPECDGQAITIVSSAIDPAQYVAEVREKLDAYPGSAYLKTSETCPSLRAEMPDGSDIYVVYFGPFVDVSTACAARTAGPRDAYVKILTFDLPFDHEVSCG